MSGDRLEQVTRQLEEAGRTIEQLTRQLVYARQERDAYAAGLRECSAIRLAAELRLEQIGERGTDRWCGAARELGGQGPCPLKTPCPGDTCALGESHE